MSPIQTAAHEPLRAMAFKTARAMSEVGKRLVNIAT
jgi:hypothetical protein